MKNKKNNLQDYKMITDITPTFSKVKGRVGIYRGSQGKKVVIKKAESGRHSPNYKFLKNEALILRSLARHKESHLLTPRYLDLIEDKKNTYLVTSYIKGRNLDHVGVKNRMEYVTAIYAKLKTLSSVLESDSFSGLPLRHPMLFLLGIFEVALKLIIREPRMIFKYIAIAISFILNYSILSLGKIEIGLAHRDLWPDNIRAGSSPTSSRLLDWESAVITDSLFDLAQIAMIYTEDFGKERMISFLRENLEDNGHVRRFYALSLYNTMRNLLNTRKNDQYYNRLWRFLEVLKTDILPSLYYKKTPFETVNGMVMNLIFLFYDLTGLTMSNRDDKVMLCYHSIGNDGWRFSTRTKLFRAHLEYIRNNYLLTSVDKLISVNKGGVVISLDDGYQNLITNALPVIEEKKIRPILFAIGKPTSANRKELDNDLPLLNTRQVILLKNCGWDIGFHSDTHPYLPDLDDKSLEREIVDGKKDFERKIGVKVRYFAYPKGKYSKRIIKYLKKSRYKAAFTVDGNLFLKSQNSDYLIDRIPVEGQLTVKQLAAMLTPLGVATSRIFLKALSIKEKLRL